MFCLVEGAEADELLTDEHSSPDTSQPYFLDLINRIDEVTADDR